MSLFLVALGLILFSGLVALMLPGPRAATAVAVGGVVAGAGLGLLPVLEVLRTGAADSFYAAWHVPYGALALEVDPLSSFFLLPTLLLSAVAAIYGAGYMQAYAGKRRLGPSWFFFNLLVAAMALVITARNGVLFLVAWEVMALASFFLVTFEDEEAAVREAGWTYLVATHLGTAFLLALFVLLGRQAGSLDFARMGIQPLEPAISSALFLLAVVGFGTKAGFMPLHVWLPEAHPAAPSHVSALMSGVMIKTGIYGLLRMTGYLGPVQAWWGWLLIGVGLLSGFLGILFALAQHDLKRLLAYSSVENIGIIALGVGTGLLGRVHGSMPLMVLGFGGALLHVLNHALFKGLLFLGAGAVLHGTGTKRIDQLGGLLKRMPATGALFLVGAVAIAGLPVLNGFVGEYLIYLAALEGGSTLPVEASVPLLLEVGGLALIGGLSAACFTRAFGIVFLGEPRSDATAEAHEAGLPMKLAMGVLAAGCLLVGVLAPVVVARLAPVLAQLAGTTPVGVVGPLEQATTGLIPLEYVAAAFLILLAVLVSVRNLLLSRRAVEQAATWDCGYAAPTARMQYTGSSFSQPLVSMLWPLLQSRRRLEAPDGLFPATASFASHTPDVWREHLYRTAFARVRTVLSSLRWLQHGRVHLYVLYILVTLLVLLVWAGSRA